MSKDITVHSFNNQTEDKTSVNSKILVYENKSNQISEIAFFYNRPGKVLKLDLSVRFFCNFVLTFNKQFKEGILLRKNTLLCTCPSVTLQSVQKDSASTNFNQYVLFF